MNLILQRTNTILYCRNWSQTVSFYRDIFNFPINHQTDWFVEFQLTDTSYLSIADVNRASIHSVDGQGITLAWQVSNIQEAHIALQKHHIEVTEIKKKWGALLFYLHDPEDHRIELWQPLPEQPANGFSQR